MLTTLPALGQTRTLLRPPPERAAPGHVYDPVSGTGIEWQPGLARLWEDGRISARASHATASPYEFWFWMQFADAFPEVTHWYFGNAWTGNVWIQPGPLAAGRPPGGWMQFGDRRAAAQPWHILPGDPPRIAIPLPPLAEDPRNLAVRVALAGLAWDSQTGTAPHTRTPPGGGAGPLPALERGSEQGGVIVTSLVARAALGAAFPLTAGRWYPAGVDRPLRQALCQCLGLARPAWLTTYL